MAEDRLDLRRSELLGRIVTRVAMGISNRVTAGSTSGVDVTAAQKALLVQLELKGSRVTTLAMRLGVSKQAASKLVHDLEGKGLVERVPDPEDKRASVIRFTDDGRHIVENTVAALERFEEAVALEIGPEDLALVKAKLKRIAALVDPHGF